MKIKKVRNFMGRGVDDNNSGLTPKESQGVGIYYGRAMKNPMGKMRDGSVGYRPVSKSQLGTPPTSVV
jgi:hypothetical protein